MAPSNAFIDRHEQLRTISSFNNRAEEETLLVSRRNTLTLSYHRFGHLFVTHECCGYTISQPCTQVSEVQPFNCSQEKPNINLIQVTLFSTCLFFSRILKQMISFRLLLFVTSPALEVSPPECSRFGCVYVPYLVWLSQVSD